MPQLANVQSNIDKQVRTDMWALFVARQDAYYVTHGHYWQGLPTHSTTPVHTNGSDGSSTPNQLSGHPTDQAETWLDIMPELNQSLASNLRFDVYTEEGPISTVPVVGSPHGTPPPTPLFVPRAGWTITCDLIHTGVLWRRIFNHGPQTWRERAWFTPPTDRV